MLTARSKSVRATGRLCCKGCAELKSRYLSVCVGFLYTEISIWPLSCRVVKVSRNGRDLFVSRSNVNWMCELTKFRCEWNSST